MAYNGREVIATIAAQHGWAIENAINGGHQPDTDVVTYTRNATHIRITWTRENTAVGIVKHTTNQGQELAQGPMGLGTARSWIEEPL